MTQSETVLRLLLVDDRLEDAEELSTALRNGGVAVRPQRPESLDDLTRLLESQSFDIVICALKSQYISFDAVVKAVKSSGKDISVLASVGKLDEANILEAIELGARNCVLRGSAAHIQHVVGIEHQAVRDRRSQRQMESAIRETERRCDALIASSRDPIAYIHEGMHIRANDAYLEIFGVESFEDIEGLSVLDMVAAEHADRFKQLLKSMSKGEPPPKSFEIKAQRGDGSVFDATIEFTQATYDREPCLQLVFRQQVIDAAMAEELEQLRQRDSVTGMFNRQYFMAELDSAVSLTMQGESKHSILIVEPDNYEAVINQIGLSHVDELLLAMAKRLESVIGDHTMIARLRDHSFVVLCDAHDYDATCQQAEAIRAAFEGHLLQVANNSLSLTVSIGGVQIGERIASVQQVLAKAGQSLQSAQGVSGNRVEIYDPAAKDRAEEERIQAWIERIKNALKSDDFVLYFQPIISLQGESLQTYEAYIRLKGQGEELVMPETFVPIAKDNGLLDELDRWVIKKAIESIAQKAETGNEVSLYVKLTADTIINALDLPTFINDAVAKAGINGSLLTLQIHEPAVYTHLNAVQQFQKALASSGVKIALEHFGTGLNSFQLLQHLNPSVLKIDRSFITELAKSTDAQTKVREMTEKARDMGKQTIAHYVQDAASMTILFSMGVDYVEGNFLAPAGPLMNYDFG